MKKLILILLLGGFALTSCQKDDLSSALNPEGVDSRGRGGENRNNDDKEDEKEEESTVICDLTPDNLPASVDFCVTDKGEAFFPVPDATTDTPSYFDLTIGSMFFNAWCADQDTALDIPDGEDEICLTGTMYSTYDEDLLDLTGPGVGEFEFPENFDQVNWLLNQDLIGEESSAFGPFTFGDIQKAIWDLIDDSTCTVCEFLGDWDQDRVDELVSRAGTEGVGYKPGSGELLALVIIPEGEFQSVIITVPVECEEVGCETAFAYSEDEPSLCFIDLEDPYNFNRWGWTIELDAEGTYTFDVYAGAGQCDLSKGTLVGTVDVTYAGGTVSVDYDIDGDYSIKETHTYAGFDPVPDGPSGNPTVAPGQYEIGTGLSGTIYVILHSVICGDYDESEVD